jgi:ubiquinone/menaquinone biosynthesis C-methylase UbiE
MEQGRGGHYSYALRYAWLTSVYDPVVRWACRESRFKSDLIRQARLSAGDRVLDLACGTGTLTIMLKQASPGAVVTGLDGSEAILDIAREKVAQAGVDVSFTHALSYDMPYEDSTFDLVLSSFFFHHLETLDKIRTLEEVLRVLAPGGELHIADWGKPLNPLFRVAFGVVQLLDGFKTTRDSVAGLLPEYMGEAGFEQVLETGRVLTPLGSVSLYSAVKPGMAA